MHSQDSSRRNRAMEKRLAVPPRYRRDEFRGGYRDEERLAIPSVEARMRVGVATIPIRLRSGQALHCGRHDRRGEGTVMAKKAGRAITAHHEERDKQRSLVSNAA